MPNYARRKVASYRQVQQATTTPAQRVVMCYAAIVRDLERALNAFADTSPNRFVDIHNAVQHASFVLRELHLALDKQAAPELAQSLEDLYTYWLDRLSDGNAGKEEEPIRQVLEMVRDVSEGWKEAAAAVAAGRS